MPDRHPYNATVIRFRQRLLVAALAAWALLGAGRFWHQVVTAPRSPAWERHLAPLREAPIPAGTEVGLLAAAGSSSREDVKPLLMEAAWQRPDLHWALLDGWPPGRSATTAVAVGAAAPPPGWRETWRQGMITVYGRERR